MGIENQRGCRLVVSLVDQYAEEDPPRAWTAIPIDEGDLSKGFQNITYADLANAVNHATIWLQQNLPYTTTDFETIAYAGPKDIRYPIIALAAAKFGRKILLPSPYAAVTAQAHLVGASECRIFLYAPPLQPVVEKVISHVVGFQPAILQIPEMSDWLKPVRAPPFPFKKTWEEAKGDPWIIFHTSGTTGMPKLITWTHETMTAVDAAELMPDADEENLNHHFENRRCYSPLPTLHVIGMFVALSLPVFLGSILVVGPASPGPTPADVARETMKYGNVQIAMLPPVLIDSLCEDDAGLDCLRSLEYLYFAGAPMMRKTAEKLLGHVVLKPAMGSTEAAIYFLKVTGDEDWEYYAFRPAMGFELRQIVGDLYEAVFVRQPELEKWQQVFKIYPELQEFPTKDLFSPHPSKPGFWKYVGRTDDMIAFSHGEDLYATGVEEEIARHPDISAALVGGQGRPRPFVIIEWKDGVSLDAQSIDQIWPTIERANGRCSDLVKLTKDLIVFAEPGKKLIRTSKGSIARRESEQLYATEIEGRYQ